jgi:hypothetical protein
MTNGIIPDGNSNSNSNQLSDSMNINSPANNIIEVQNLCIDEIISNMDAPTSNP